MTRTVLSDGNVFDGTVWCADRAWQISRTRGGRFVMAHAIALDGVENAVREGIRSIEHGTFLDDEAMSMGTDCPVSPHGTNIVGLAERVRRVWQDGVEVVTIADAG